MWKDPEDIVRMRQRRKVEEGTSLPPVVSNPGCGLGARDEHMTLELTASSVEL